MYSGKMLVGGGLVYLYDMLPVRGLITMATAEGHLSPLARCGAIYTCLIVRTRTPYTMIR